MERKCAICDRSAPKSCSSCLSVAYCSAEHQKEHWKFHRKDCSYFRITDDPELGKGFVATRDIKEGTIILEETPVVFSAFWDAPSCITCGLKLPRIKHRARCPKCHWPVCSPECSEITVHKDNECDLFFSKAFRCTPQLLNDQINLYRLMAFIRASFLKNKEPEIYQQVLDLCSSYRLLEDDDRIQRRLDLMMPYLNMLDLDLDDLEMKKLHRVLVINSFNCTDSWKGIEHSAVCLYLKTSQMNHSCVPNCTWTNSPAPEYKIRVRTATEVKKGDPLTFTYYAWEAFGGTKQRQEKLRDTFGFQCKCARCLDPTELLTYASAIGCSSCQPTGNVPIGYLLPENPLDLSQNAIWKCNGCESVKLASDILGPVEALGKMVLKHLEENKISDCHLVVEKCENVVRRYSGKLLHPNHWVLQKARRAVVDCYSKSHYDSLKVLEVIRGNYFIKCCKDLLAIQDVVSPGSSNNRAGLQMAVGYGFLFRGKHLVANGRYLEAVPNLQQAIHLHREALKFFSADFPKVDGTHHPADILMHNIRTTPEYLESILSKTFKNCI